MTKKELAKIVDALTAAVTLRLTEGMGESYEPTTAEQDEARTLVGIALKRNRAAILASIPVFAPMAASQPVPQQPVPLSALLLAASAS